MWRLEFYELAGVEKPNEEALNLVEWLTARVKIAKITPDTAVEAGEIEKKFGISLSDQSKSACILFQQLSL